MAVDEDTLRAPPIGVQRPPLHVAGSMPRDQNARDRVIFEMVMASAQRLNAVDADVIETRAFLIVLERSFRRLEAKVAPGGEVDRRARQASRPVIEDVAREVAARVGEQVEDLVDEVTGRHHVPDAARPLTSERVREVAADVLRDKESDELREAARLKRERRESILRMVVGGILLMAASYVFGRLTATRASHDVPDVVTHSTEH